MSKIKKLPKINSLEHDWYSIDMCEEGVVLNVTKDWLKCVAEYYGNIEEAAYQEAADYASKWNCDHEDCFRFGKCMNLGDERGCPYGKK